LVDDDKALGLFARSDCLITDCVLELDNLLESVIDESTLGLDKLFSLLRRRVEESRVDLAIDQILVWTYGAPGNLRLFVF
jgi:hypothetical protein